MNHLSTRIAIVFAGLLAIAASQANADYLNWAYTANSNVPGIAVDATSPTGGASVTLTNYSTPQAGGTSIPVQAYVTSTSNTTPITFGPSSDVPTTYNLALTITDNTTHDSGTLSFTGSLAGSLTASTSSVVNTLTPVTSNTLTLDGHNYTVTIPTVTLAAPTSPQQDIRAMVSVTNAGSGNPGNSGSFGNVNGVPEPTGLVLAGMGLSSLGVTAYWRGLRRWRDTDAA